MSTTRRGRHQPPKRRDSQRQSGRGSGQPPAVRRGDGRIWLWGRHAVAAALANPERPCHRLVATTTAFATLDDLVRRAGMEQRVVEPGELDRRLGGDAAHQGLVLEVGPLPPRDLVDLDPDTTSPRLLLALDQVSDPRNLGAILRSASALGVGGVIVPRHGSAELGGACAKAASGALDRLPIAEVVNLARALDTLKERGFETVGLDAAGPVAVEALPPRDRRVLVLGAEGAGLRRLVAERCDALARLTIDPAAESLNVSVAAGIALYLLAHRRHS